MNQRDIRGVATVVPVWVVLAYRAPAVSADYADRN
jgi:hypothetical protein